MSSSESPSTSSPSPKERPRSSYQSTLTHLKSTHAHNLSTFLHQTPLEISGSFGDVGTFFPIFIALTLNRLISAPATLVFSGLANILTGFIFGLPLPVQPMKAIASVALSDPERYAPAHLASAGLSVAAAVGLFSATGLLNWFTAVVPVPVVKGIQVGAGLSLATGSAWSFLAPLFQGPFRGYVEEYVIDVCLFAGTLGLLLLCTLRPRTPFVLILLVISIVVGMAVWVVQNWTNSVYNGNPYFGPRFGVWKPEFVVPTGLQFLDGTLSMGLGQLPLTTLNSVLAVVVLAEDLYPPGSIAFETPSAGAVGASVAAMNLLAVWFGSMPFCHGSGGLAAQHRFGARSGASVIFLGVLKLVLGLFAAEWVVAWCQGLRGPVLGVLVFLAGVELGKMGESVNGKGARDLWESTVVEIGGNGDEQRETKVFREVNAEERMRRWVVMLVTVAAILGAKNDGIGFVVGMGVHWSYRFKNWVDERWGVGRIRLDDEEVDDRRWGQGRIRLEDEGEGVRRRRGQRGHTRRDMPESVILDYSI